MLRSFVLRRFPGKENLDCELVHLEGGISNKNYKVSITEAEENTGEKMVMTIFFAPNSWWKVDKVHFLKETLDGDSDVLMPAIIDWGKDHLGEQKIAFLFRKFVEGYDLDQAFRAGTSIGLYDDDWSEIARDLGFRIGALHIHSLPGFGQITGAEDQLSQRLSWKDFCMQQMHALIRTLRSFPFTKQIASCRVDQIVSLLPAVENLVNRHAGALETVETPHLVHGDARFANFIVGCDNNGKWRVQALIDWEWAMAGDPEVDLACIENWLYCSRYQKPFYRIKHEFIAGYNAKRSISLQYQEKRFVYHALRSQSFLCGAFGLLSKESAAAPDLVRSVEQNYQILRSLARGAYLEDLGILPIYDSPEKRGNS